MQSHSIPISNISFNDQVFSSGKPFEAVTSNQGLSIVRTRRSPDIGSGNQVSVNSHLRSRTYYWFGPSPNWSVTVNNLTGSFINIIQVIHIATHTQFGTQYRSGTASVTRTGISTTPTTDTFSPFGALTNLRMDASQGVSMFFDIVVPSINPIPNNINIDFNWGNGTITANGNRSVGSALTTSNSFLSAWFGNGNNGVNTTITLT